jgi:tetratricopeptide (TPR) repeat protein
VLNLAGRPEEAFRLVEQAMRLNPHYPPVYLLRLGWAYFSIGRYAEAVATLKKTINRNPNLLIAHLILAGSYVQQWASQQGPDTHTLALAMATAQRVLTLNDALPTKSRDIGLCPPVAEAL